MTQAQPSLQTDRLVLQPMVPNDAAALHAVYSQPEAMRFMPTPPHGSAEETRMWITRDLSRQGAHYWTVRLKDAPDTIIGQIDFLGETALPGMGYIIHPDYWNQGITTEACRAALQYGYDTLGFDRVELWIAADNGASQRVAKKLGFSFKSNLPMKYAHRPTHHTMLVFGQWAHEWRNQTQPAQAQTRFYNAQAVLMVHDVAKSAAFYRDKLGFRIDFLYGEPADHAGVTRGSWSASGVTLQLTRVPAERDLTPAGYLYIFVDHQIDQLYEQYRDNGVEILREPASKPWGMREFAVKDCNGHILLFGSHT